METHFCDYFERFVYTSGVNEAFVSVTTKLRPAAETAGLQATNINEAQGYCAPWLVCGGG